MLDRFKNALRRALGLECKERVQLIQMCSGDQEAAGRLVKGERSRSPGLSEAEACKRAIERLQRDNR
jgi:hypothetical protein